MTTQPGVALQWKAVGPSGQAPTATVSIRPHFPFGEGAINTGSVVFPATNTNPSSASFFAVPLVGTFDASGRLLGPDGYPLVVPALDAYATNWLQSPKLYEVQINLEGISGQRGVFAAFHNTASNFAQGLTGIIVSDPNASTSALTGSGASYSGTVYLADTIVSPVLVNQSIYVVAGSDTFSATVTAINLLTNSVSITATAPHSAHTNATFYWGNAVSGVNLAVDLSQYVNWY